MLSSVAGTKRKSSDGAGAEAPPVDLNDIHIPDGLPMESCQVVRGKISRFLEAGEMKVGEFCNAIGVSGNAYRRFMASNGKDKGMFSDVYPQAWAFFKKRELAGIKPVKKRKSATGASESDKLLDLSQVHVDGMYMPVVILIALPCCRGGLLIRLKVRRTIASRCTTAVMRSGEKSLPIYASPALHGLSSAAICSHNSM